MKMYLFLCLFLFQSLAFANNTDAIKYLPVQDAGRIKPFDTFARESLQLIYGKQTFKKKDAVEIVLTWALAPDHWDRVEFVEVRHSGLREALKLDKVRLHYSPNELMNNERVGLVIQELKSEQKINSKLNPYFQAVQSLQNRITLYHAIKVGQLIRLAPRKDSDTWVSLVELEGGLKDQFAIVTSQFVKNISLKVSNEKETGSEVSLKDSLHDFIELARAQAPEKYADPRKIQAEVHLNLFRPFLWSWVAYLIGALFMLAFIISNKGFLYKLSWLGILIGFLLSAYGMGLRVFLLGRPPVSNMYETVIWVPWGGVLFAMIMEIIKKNSFVLLAASLISVLCLILTDLSPTVLDPSLQPLEPVLRDNFWLLTHVLIITLSYGAFFLAFALGDIGLIYYLKDENKYKPEIANLVNGIYRSMQIGVVLLAAGTILGGIWADYSWGRFWGWDPKETWAFIALMGYLAILHGRMAGWIRNFGMVCFGILTFSLVIMAWYGVNFILGAGLHSYGFGAGGVEYVTGFVALHLLYVVFVWQVRRSRLQKQS